MRHGEKIRSEIPSIYINMYFIFYIPFIIRDFHSIWFINCCIVTFQFLILMLFESLTSVRSFWFNIHEYVLIDSVFSKYVNVLIDHEKVNQGNIIEQCQLNAFNSAQCIVLKCSRNAFIHASTNCFQLITPKFGL